MQGVLSLFDVNPCLLDWRLLRRVCCVRSISILYHLLLVHLRSLIYGVAHLPLLASSCVCILSLEAGRSRSSFTPTFPACNISLRYFPSLRALRDLVLVLVLVAPKDTNTNSYEYIPNHNCIRSSCKLDLFKICSVVLIRLDLIIWYLLCLDN